ncbi:ADP-ribose pyrophosphatase (plasmid) [Paraburkholderia sp. PGU19]|uniref:NUDIX domain-containing protein n=1 Tax=Paraburkholderia sp. PGU19 TaxID=2735434 RepID=UPI0015DB5E2D|nr:NUDIX domain-containing protein [Paraburkholderia sp. PGU19]BCG02976.1 ADP-ribose pyrophosphatase [Paraburkholderia sp. PGU19]
MSTLDPTKEYPYPLDGDFDAVVFIGRFQLGMHNGQLALVHRGLDMGEEVIIVLGSAHRARSPRHPLHAAEREAVIRSCLTGEQNQRVKFVYIRDYYDDDRWCAAVRSGVGSLTNPNVKIALIGHEKDRSSYYLHLFPEWKLFKEPSVGEVNETEVRSLWFEREYESDAETFLRTMVPAGTYQFLTTFKKLPLFESLRNQHYAIRADVERWKVAPYVPNHSCLDAVVEFREHVLLIERGGEYGTGALAWPGGFLEPDERVVEGALRELREESSLAIRPELLRTFIRDRELFDDPCRSEAGRRLSHAFYFNLNDGGFEGLPAGELPPVKGCSDARHAMWVPKTQLPSLEERFFEDHFMIGDRFLHYVLPVVPGS